MYDSGKRSSLLFRRFSAAVKKLNDQGLFNFLILR